MKTAPPEGEEPGDPETEDPEPDESVFPEGFCEHQPEFCEVYTVPKMVNCTGSLFSYVGGMKLLMKCAPGHVKCVVTAVGMLGFGAFGMADSCSEGF